MEFNQKIKLAELIGIILGDGNLHKKQNCVTIVGSLEDFHYYTNHVTPLIKSLFDVNPKLRKRNDRNSFYIDFSSKKTMDYLSKSIGLIRGNKVNASVPDIIKKDIRLMFPFLRGLFDTDGSLKFSKQTKNLNYYPRIQLAFKKSNFVNEVEAILRKLKIKFGKWEEREKGNELRTVRYHISGKKNLERWVEDIGFNNPVHKTKYLFWKKFGHYIPKSTLNDRLNALNLNIDDIFQ